MNTLKRAAKPSTDTDLPHGMALLRDPLLNKGTAFTEQERDALGLRGLLPAHVLSMQAQAERVMTNLRRLPNDLDKYVALNALHDRNEALFFRIVADNIDEIQPLIYTPTVGLACQKFGDIFQRPRGLFVSANDRGRIRSVLRNWPYSPKLIVVSDGERILGLGDLGANGMGIPVGKLSLYSACAGIHPKLCLPVMLDVGTNNEAFLTDSYYVGLRQKRLTGAAYDEFVDEFIIAAREADARGRIWLMDSRGLVVKDRAGLNAQKLRYAHAHSPVGDFLSAIKDIKPTAIIGVAAVGGTFTPEVLRTMAQINKQPIIFALSNPTSKAECSAEDAYRRTGGRALFACGSPYDPVTIDGKTFVPRQGNNSYIFPGVGLGAIASAARLITDEMFMAAAQTLAQMVTEADLKQGRLYPALPRIREVSARIGAAVAAVAYQRGLADGAAPNDLLALVQSQMYDPRY